MSIPPYRSKINIINNLNFSLTMWLTNSSIGRKVIMSVTGLALILFLTFHGCMNVVALFSREGYNWVPTVPPKSNGLRKTCLCSA